LYKILASVLYSLFLLFIVYGQHSENRRKVHIHEYSQVQLQANAAQCAHSPPMTVRVGTVSNY